MEIIPVIAPELIEFNLSQLILFGDEYPPQSPLHPGNRSRGSDDLNDTGDWAFDESDIKFQRIINILDTYVLPVIILVGIVGNTLSFFVYIWTPRLFRQSSSLYLAFLAMVDNISLVSVLVVWFGWVGIHIFHKNGWCQTITYGTYVCSFLSAWIVVTFTFERWIIVFHPLRRHELCTRRRAIIVMTSLTLTSLAFYSFSLYTTTVRHLNNMPVCTTYHNAVLKILIYIDTIVTIFVPLLAIILMNLGIGVKICLYTARRGAGGRGGAGMRGPSVPADSADEIYSNCSTTNKCGALERGGGGAPLALVGASKGSTTTRAVVSVSAAGGGTAWRVLTRRQHTQARVTSALLVVSSVFVVLNIPSYAFRIHAFVISIREEAYEMSMNAYIWQEFIQFLYYSNISSRFFLYAACSRNFRYAVRRLACRQRCAAVRRCRQRG